MQENRYCIYGCCHFSLQISARSINSPNYCLCRHLKLPPTDAEILADFLETGNISDDELVNDSDDVEDVTMECPGKNELLHALERFQKFSLFAADGDTVQLYKLF